MFGGQSLAAGRDLRLRRRECCAVGESAEDRNARSLTRVALIRRGSERHPALVGHGAFGALRHDTNERPDRIVDLHRAADRTVIARETRLPHVVPEQYDGWCI